mgnify:CR=1 FL=1
MSTAIAAPVTSIVQWGMSREQIELLKRTVADGTTDDEFALFMTTAQRLGLDPFAKQIYAVKRPTYDRQRREYIDKMTIQVGIDGFRSVADRTGQNDGQDGPFWCGEDGVWHDVWLHDSPPAAAKVVVWRKGSAKPFTGVASYRSYVQTNKDNKPNRQWEQMPDVMLAKCAEALALRKAFPSQLSGVYAPEEMGQADNERAREPYNANAIASPERAALPEVTEGVLADIDIAPDEAALQALVPHISKLPDAVKAEARKRYGARREYLRKLAADLAASMGAAS